MRIRSTRVRRLPASFPNKPPLLPKREPGRVCEAGADEKHEARRIAADDLPADVAGYALPRKDVEAALAECRWRGMTAVLIRRVGPAVCPGRIEVVD